MVVDEGRTSQAVNLALAGVGLIFLAGFFYVTLSRLRYPFELEWIEGAFLDQVRWITKGEAPYQAPALAFIPTSKTPLYFYLASLTFRVFGAGFLGPRLLSVLASTGAFLLIGRINYQYTKSWPLAIAAAGLYAASYRFSGAWMDLVKTDSLLIFLVLLAFWLGWRTTSPYRLILSGVVFAAAYFTKQLALPIIVAYGLASLIATRGRSWPQWSTAASVGLGIYVLLERSSQGWFSFYTISTSIHHDRIPNILRIWNDSFPILWPALLLGSFFIVDQVLKFCQAGWTGSPAPLNLIGFGLALIAASWSIYFKTGTYDNAFMPVAASLALLAPRGFTALYKRIPANGVIRFAALALVLLQFWQYRFDPQAQIPSAAAREQGQSFVTLLDSLPGKVWVFNHGFYTHLADKPTFFHFSPYNDVISSDFSASAPVLIERQQAAERILRQTLQGQAVDWLITDMPDDQRAPYYLWTAGVSANPDFLRPQTGAVGQPRSVLAKNTLLDSGVYPLTDPLFDGWFFSGWSPATAGGRWLEAAHGSLQVALTRAHSYDLTVIWTPWCVSGQPVVESLELAWDEQSLGEMTIEGCDAHSLTTQVPVTVISAKPQTLNFRVRPSQASEQYILLQAVQVTAATE
jgi:hypothetical protein